MINCSEIIKGCLLNGKSYDCTTLFKEHFSEWGSTCIFNGIPAKATRRYGFIKILISYLCTYYVKFVTSIKWS